MLFFHFLFVLSNEACSLMLILQIFSLFFSLFYSALSSWRHVKRHPLSKMLHKNQTTDWTRKILKIKAIKTQKSPYMKLEQWLVFSVIFRALMTQVSRRTIFQCTHTHTRTHTHTHTHTHRKLLVFPSHELSTHNVFPICILFCKIVWHARFLGEWAR